MALAGITSATIDPGSVVGSPGAAPGLGSDATTGRTTGTIPEQRWATSIPTTERTDRAHARRVTAWTVLLTDLPGALVPSARHLLTALDHRGDARGSLAAALSCWQGMFGTADGTDDSFQVCTALTLLVEPDPCRRPTVLTDLRRLYAARSHEVGSGAHARDRDLAVDIALRGLGAALHRPALLAASTPDERAACVVLGESSDSLHHEAQSHVVACHCPAPEVPTDT